MDPCHDCAGCDLPVATQPAEQPLSVEIKMADGIFIKSMHVHKAGTIVPSHKHAYYHVSVLTLGAVRVWENGVLSGEHEAPGLLTIRAGVTHTFLTLADATLILCIHRIDRTGEVEILDADAAKEFV